jgi:hypothetical protein
MRSASRAWEKVIWAVLDGLFVDAEPPERVSGSRDHADPQVVRAVLARVLVVDVELVTDRQPPEVAHAAVG